MCLHIDKIDFNETTTQKVYKVVTQNPKLDFGPRLPDTLYSIFFYHKWKIGEVAVSNRDEPELGEYERELREAWEGFHFFTSLEDAKCEKDWRAGFEILECEVQPEDYVAQGYWTDVPCVVYTKCKVLRQLNG